MALAARGNGTWIAIRDAHAEKWRDLARISSFPYSIPKSMMGEIFKFDRRMERNSEGSVGVGRYPRCGDQEVCRGSLTNGMAGKS